MAVNPGSDSALLEDSEPVALGGDGLRAAWRRLAANRLALVGGGIVVVVALTALFAPLIARQDPIATDPYNTLLPPSLQHFFGTDK